MKSNKIKTRPVEDKRIEYVDIIAHGCESVYDIEFQARLRMTIDDYEAFKKLTWEEQKQWIEDKQLHWTEIPGSGKDQGLDICYIERCLSVPSVD